ncbi:hypothetical protein F4X33_15295 [Candidatus Poribacteria bacterium]|nr:hypothetical protein [Candidatus Poribacteria bacterium]
MTTNINWQELWTIAKAADEPMTPGEHQVTITSAQWGKSKQHGKDQLTLRGQVVSGPDAGKTALHWITLSPENPTALSIAFDDLRALGLPPEVLSTINPQQIAQQIVGSAVIFITEVSDRSGRLRTDVKRIRAVQEGILPGIPSTPQPLAAPPSAPASAPPPLPL